MKLLFLKYKNRLLFACLLSFLLGCKKFVAIDAPATSISSETLFSSDQGAVSAVTGLYSQMSQINLNIANGGTTIYGGLSSDEIYNTSANNSYDQFRKNALTSDNSAVSSRLWNAAYKTIYQANAILEGLQSSTSISQETKNQLRGEMLFIRAFHYFYLTNFFGDVPYIATTNYKVNAVSPRIPVSQIDSSIISDLKEAQSLLIESYPTNTKGRPNKWTATALLARVYLYHEDWANAEAEASLVINAGTYSLDASLNSVFQPSSSESIWFLQRDNTNTAEGINFVPPSSTTKPSLSITSFLFDAFEPGDKRKDAWLKSNIVNGLVYYYPYKYKTRISTPITEYLVVFRLAELYLIRAEARAKQSKLIEGEVDVNTIRNRAGLVDVSVSDTPSLLLAIEQERRTELFLEWGHRWFDLKRTGRADAILSAIKGSNWQSTDQLYPIPLSELQTNPSLTQNASY